MLKVHVDLDQHLVIMVLTHLVYQVDGSQILFLMEQLDVVNVIKLQLQLVQVELLP